MVSDTVRTVLMAGGALLAVVLFWEQDLALTAVLLAVAGAYLYPFHDREKIVTCAVSGVLGAASEAVAVWHGAWTYAAPTAAGIPLWLPVLWGLAALTILRIHDRVSPGSSRGAGSRS